MESAGEYFPDAQWQRCTVHFYRNVFSVVPRIKTRHVADMRKAIHAQEDLEAAQEKVKLVINKLRSMRLNAAADKVQQSIHETFSFYRFPKQHWIRLKRIIH